MKTVWHVSLLVEAYCLYTGYTLLQNKYTPFLLSNGLLLRIVYIHGVRITEIRPLWHVLLEYLTTEDFRFLMDFLVIKKSSKMCQRGLILSVLAQCICTILKIIRQDQYDSGSGSVTQGHQENLWGLFLMHVVLRNLLLIVWYDLWETLFQMT